VNGDGMPGIRDLLHAAAERMSEAGIEGGRLDARILLAQAMQITRDELIAASRKPTTDEAERFEALIRRRLAREPIAYITGRKEFWSLDFAVGPGVLVPRPDTETLIEAALNLAKAFPPACGWTPVRIDSVAGRLAYQEYGFFIRWVMKWIAKKEGAPTDTSRDYELTNWEEVDKLARDMKRRIHAREAVA